MRIIKTDMNKANQYYDLFVIGGGVNGTGIAADAAGRGLNVFLAEQNDLASATSSSSSKLIHGGLRYLEHYEFRLVKEALAEREVLLKNAKHIMRPLTFRLPHQPHLRPAWMIRAGLFLYDNLAKRVTLHGSRSIRFNGQSPLKASITKGFEYSDGWVDDARLVVFNALAAKQNGAHIATRTECVKAERHADYWHITLKAKNSEETEIIKAKGIVNAAGPWVSKLFNQALPSESAKQIRLVKGSHIIVPKLHDQPQAYILQNEDQRIVFVLPYEEQFSLIGTTDIDYQGDPAKVKISAAEIDYLLNISNSYFKRQINRQDVISDFSGVRPLIDDNASAAQAVTRDYTLTLDDEQQLPLLSVFGGKITTYRRLAENAVDKLASFYPHMGQAWTAKTPLPGSHFDNLQSLTTKLTQDFPWAWGSQIRRYASCYGTLAYLFLQDVKSKQQLGKHFGSDLYQAEVDYLIENEWAVEAEDILWRRTKLGLQLNQQQVEQLKQYLALKTTAKAA